ncbi:MULTISPECIES: flagellar assembly protein T N-terminal domain-containing protein [unclassified Pseudoalteromonas]|uniref:flagellar assembly protein T N-terminal domain-containing protein n=1 Tax=unclassified Pseudoalteromonas TaxID=194690 RepID=UPI0025B35368|nr:MULTISPECIES: flagellar assembly protein T N-terminal domain-containing protein [unclassified Pseudoalteromonas]MDN3430508.1 flagellar assembly protein T N-terminal domain-containing protein [Pseudoalteromonas sp. APC 3907]MDN3465245.1 flagellar assembly protein T N-terminal domain-containing protein [Pseudoalteromonas sp. APC 3495]
MKSFLKAVLAGLSTTAVLTFSPFTHAQWYESTGHAVIQNSDIPGAKAAAIKDAITQALVFSGARVSSVQTLVDGVLTQDQLKISSQGEIQKIELVSENRSSDEFAITLRLDIFAQTEQCPQSNFNKFIAVTQSQLTNREQARMGQIFDINKAVSKNIYTSLQKSKMSAIPVAYFNKAIKVDTYFNQQHDYSNSQLEEISSRSNAQYVLLSQITSLSTSDKLNSDYAFWQDESYQRHYQIEFSLFNGTTYEPLWQKSYQSQAIWPFEKTAIIDVNSNRFWQSPFGQSISDINQTLSYDLQAAMACLPTQGKIMHMENNKLVINLGKAHGLEEGQLLSIAHHNYLTDAQGNTMPHTITTLNRIRIEQLYQLSAIAVSINDQPLPGVQINDIVEIAEQ